MVPQGTPVNLIANIHPRDLANAREKLPAEIQEKLEQSNVVPASLVARPLEALSGEILMYLNQCPDFVEDRGHYFGQFLTDQEKRDLKAFLKRI